MKQSWFDVAHPSNPGCDWVQLDEIAVIAATRATVAAAEWVRGLRWISKVTADW
jgi:hypothetical protein